MIRRPVTTRHLNRILKKFGIENQNLPQTPLNLPLLSHDKPISIWFKKFCHITKHAHLLTLILSLTFQPPIGRQKNSQRKEKYREKWEYKWESKGISCLIDTFLGKFVTFPFCWLITHLIDITFTILIFSEISLYLLRSLDGRLNRGA